MYGQLMLRDTVRDCREVMRKLRALRKAIVKAGLDNVTIADGHIYESAVKKIESAVVNAEPNEIAKLLLNL